MKWTPEAEAALQDFKIYLSSAPTLVAPRAQEPLLLYLAARNQVVSVVLVAKREVEDKGAANAELSSNKLEYFSASPGVDKSSADQADAMELQVVQKKKLVWHPVYFASALLKGAR